MTTTLFIAATIILWGCICLLGFFLWKTRNKNRLLEQTLRLKRDKKDTEIVNKIRLSKKQLETSFDAIRDCLCVIDTNFKILRANKSYADAVHLPIRNILGKTCYEIFWKRSSVCERCPAKQTIASGVVVSKQHFTLRSVGGARYFDIGTFPVMGLDGKPENVIEQIRDVTEEKSVLEQLIRSEKLATIGTMTAGIAHEMINPLSGISGTVTNMLNAPHKYGLNDKGKQRLSNLMDAVSRATMIMKDLLHLSRKEDATTVLTDINSVVVKAVNAVQLKGYSQVEYKMLLEKSLTKVLCDPLKIEQVIINMVTNAVQSIMEKNEAMALKGAGHNGLIIVSTQQVDENVHIDIIDNGMGIADDIKGKIFDPFFTTRSPGEGTGLGLSVCHRIIEEHNGSIHVESNSGLTTFTIHLPALPQAAAIVV
jgi:two-component system, NtrC family, sensor kinase